MTADLLDPWDQPADSGDATTSQPLLTPDEQAAITHDLWDGNWDDPARFPECLKLAVETLGAIGCGTGPAPAVQATQALRRMVNRAVTGEPLDEPQEPAWSLDPTPRHIPRGEG